MKVLCNTLGVLMGIQNAIKAVSPRTPLPILTHILIKAEKGELIFAATDLEFGIECRIEAEILEEGGVAVPAKVLAELVSQIDDEKISLELKESMLEVRTENSVYQMSARTWEEFPIMPRVEEPASLTIAQGTLKKMIKKVAFCIAGPDEPRMILTGILVRVDDRGIMMVATDTRRLALMEEPIENPPSKEMSVVVPGKALSEISKLLRDTEETVDVYIGNGQVFLKFERLFVYSRLIEGKYPDYEQVIPQTCDTKITIEKDRFQRATRRALIMAQEKDSPWFLQVEVKDGKVILITDTPDLGQAREEIPAQVEGSNVSVSFNGKFLLEEITNVDSSDLYLQLTNKANPGLIKAVDDESYLYIVMPLRLKREEEEEEYGGEYTDEDAGGDIREYDEDYV